MSPRTRNETEYEATLQQIKAIARQQMTAGGTASLSLRAIAREMDITAPALYRYYPSRDDLITALIVDAYNAQADAQAAADAAMPTDDFAGRLLAVLLAYRQWALEHPTDFQLIYGNPIPGYEAPLEVTLPVARRGLQLIVGIIGEAITAGALKLPPQQIPPTVAASLAGVIQHEGFNISIDALYFAVMGWTRLHGMTALELYYHTQFLVTDTEAFFRQEITNLIESLFL